MFEVLWHALVTPLFSLSLASPKLCRDVIRQVQAANPGMDAPLSFPHGNDMPLELEVLLHCIAFALSKECLEARASEVKALLMLGLESWVSIQEGFRDHIYEN